MTESQSLNDLIRSIGSGDPSAFAALYNQMREPLYNRVLMRYGSILGEQDAEDVIHNTFIKIYQYAPRFRGAHNDAGARKWIHKIARTQAMKMVRAKKRTPISLDDDSDDDSNDGNDPGGGALSAKREALLRDPNWEPGHSVEHRVERAELVKKIFSIPQVSPEEKELLFLRYVYGYTFDELGRHIRRTKPRAKQKHDGIVREIRNSLKMDVPLD